VKTVLYPRDDDDDYRGAGGGIRSDREVMTIARAAGFWRIRGGQA
jgi:hypothetical protein